MTEELFFNHKELAVSAALGIDSPRSVRNGLLWFVTISPTDAAQIQQRPKCAEKVEELGVRKLLQSHSKETDLAKQVSENNLFTCGIKCQLDLITMFCFVLVQFV